MRLYDALFRPEGLEDPAGNVLRSPGTRTSLGSLFLGTKQGHHDDEDISVPGLADRDGGSSQPGFVAGAPFLPQKTHMPRGVNTFYLKKEVGSFI